MLTVYILYSKNRDQYYIGSTEDVQGRIRRHNTNHKGFTGNSNDWQLVWEKEFNIKTEAIKFERLLKSWKSRKMIEKIIEQADQSIPT
jgi:putative endonuclease